MDPEDIRSQVLSDPIDLIFIDGSVSEAQANHWAKQLRCHSQFREIPIIALSPQNPYCHPWTDRSLGIEDYILTPFGGEHLLHHLRKFPLSALKESFTDLYWFPH